MPNMPDLKLKIFFQSAVVFATAAVLSLATAASMITGKVAYTDEPVKSVYVPPATAPPFEPAQLEIFQFLVSFLVATALMLFFLKAFKGKFLFQMFFGGAVIFGAQGPLGLIVSPWQAFLISFLVVGLRFALPRIWTQNLAIILAAAGIAASLGMSVEPNLVILILILLSIYDVVAVYKTRHMVKLFKGIAERGVYLALIIPDKISGWGNKFIGAGKNKNYVFIGTGDLALPLFFSVSAFPFGIIHSVAIVTGAILGLLADHLFFVTQKKRKPIPALPFIAFFSIMGYLVSLFI
jgi:presenilin-like A22 family membrane protease